MKESKITCARFNKLCEEAKLIRKEVFIKEQGFKNEFDDWDDKVRHVVLFLDEKPAATGRLLPGKDKNTFAIGRVAVLKEFRKHHLGSKIISELEKIAQECGGTKIELSAQCRARGFYEKLGYVADGGIYYDEYCPHVHMEKQI